MGRGVVCGMCGCGKPWSFKTNYSVHLRSIIHSSLPFVYLTSLCCILPPPSEKLRRWFGGYEPNGQHKWRGRVQKIVTRVMSCLFVCFASPHTPCVPTLVAFQFVEFIDHKLFTPNAAVPKTYGMVYSVRFQSALLYPPRGGL